MLHNEQEKRVSHKGSGRPYGYPYVPLRDRGQSTPAFPEEAWQDEGEMRRPSRPGGSLAPRPDPRRTRQLMRQQILASKARSAVLELPRELELYEEEEELRSAYRPQRRGSNPQRAQEFEEERIVEDWLRHGEGAPDYMDSDLEDTSDPLAERVRQIRPPRSAAPLTRKLTPEEEDELLDAELKERKRRDQRRKLLFGALLLGGAGVAAYEILPRLPQAIGAGASNLEHQLQQAFQNGVKAGGEAARKDLLNALDDLEGFSLEGAIEAAKLTRVAYDVFISPLVTLAAVVTDDFLETTLQALITGRKWLAQINEDSPTLAALQNVLQSWVKQVSEMPKTIQTITETDLDGAQAYLRALQRKIQTEQADLNKQK